MINGASLMTAHPSLCEKKGSSLMASPPPSSPGLPAWVDWLVFFGCVATWGTSFAALKVAAAEVSPLWVAALRMVVAAVFLFGLLAMLKERLPPLSDQRRWLTYAAIGVIGTALPYTLFSYAAGAAPSAVVAICNGGSPFFTALLAHLLLPGEKLSLHRALSVGFGFAGLVVLAAPGLLAAPVAGAGQNLEALGIIAGIGGAFCYAIANIQVKQAPALSAASATTIYCLAGAGAAFPLALAAAPAPTALSLEASLAVLGLGIFSTALGGVGFVFLVQRRGPVFTAFTTYLLPLWALGLGVVFLGETPGANAYLALGLILTGLLVFNAPALFGRRPHTKGRSGHQG
jgi:drug/metabolite transporter (DMT)-like permease